MMKVMVNPYEDTPGDVVVTRQDYADGELFPMHSHRRGQFAYAACGVITVETEAGNWAVPPLRAIWVPAGLSHAMQMRGPVTMLNTYIRPHAAQSVGLPEHCQVFGVSTLVQQLLEKAVDVPAHHSSKGRDAHLMGLLLYEIANMPALSLNAPIPGEPRLALACNGFLAAPSLEIGIDDMAERAGMSRRTFTRQFRTYTGISYIEWRQQACLLAAVVRLGNGEPVTRVAMDLGYSSPSAFATVFKSALGETPSRYFQGPQY
ncbi:MULTISPECIES: AraC family transcriptional regulator [unclassified Pseudomonas]|uniref:AraC family transcriptional regulator n=1 Tax=unclassified Pseudomonas TaxID=196821 RepID=UPI0021C84E2B|nr:MULTISPECIES: helix-turn-helix transcriptional regulator [unclassified Pseudomonas]MCU1724948.1 helix-turn-helix transcriptional regulator [Pseudomonas sp. 5P_5.1_Bac1]MCU1732807.1 helix-turn-helix transcriptional regulator [Pseudomonas sp. 20P_3.2_Bac4]MCU1745114.1 helix-turn-helix transcriptional regulator [Pseudomonas sp. 20P_3.2_Bac5]